MVWTIARNELKMILRDGRFRASGGIVAALLLVAIAFGWHHQQQVIEERREALADNRQQWIEQGPRNPHSAAHFGVHAYKTPMPLAFFDRGLDPYIGSTIWLEAHWQNPANHRPARDSAAARRFGELTAATVLQVLGPLLVILLTFAAFSGERESGTLRQLLSLGISPMRLLAGKALGIALGLAVLLAPAAALGLVALAVSWGELSRSGGRLAVLAAAYGLYLAIFLGLSLAASARARSSRLSLVLLLGFWAFSTLLVPRLVGDLADRLYPSPSGKEYWDAVRADIEKGIDGHDPNDARLAELERETLERYGVERLEELPINFAGLRLQAGEEHSNTIHDQHQARLWGSYQKQEELFARASLLAPTAALRLLSMGMAGTDLAHHRTFADGAERYRRVINKMLNDDLTFNSRTHEFRYFADRELWESIPELRDEPLAFGSALEHHVSRLGILGLWALVSGVAAIASVRRLRAL